MLRSLLWMFAFFLALQQQAHHQVVAAAPGCDPTALSAKYWYALQKENGDTILKIYEPQLLKALWRIRLGKAEDQEYRIFFKKAKELLVVSCFIEEEDNHRRVCGYNSFKIPDEPNSGNVTKDDEERGKFMENEFWFFKPFSFGKNFSRGSDGDGDYIDMAKIFYDDDKNILHLNKKNQYVFAAETKTDRRPAFVDRGKDNCFKENHYCAFELRHKRLIDMEIKEDQIQSAGVPLYFYDRLKFFAGKNGFYLDNLFGEHCYGTKTYELLLPYLSTEFGEVAQVKFIKEFGDMIASPKQECAAAGTFAKIEKELGKPMKTYLEYYDSNDNPIPDGSSIRGGGNNCHDDSIYLYLFIVSAVLAGIITGLVVALIVIIVMARKKMIKQGRRLPKKPWETQADEDCATLMDQTVGVTEATTVGGETSAYTTVGQ